MQAQKTKPLPQQQQRVVPAIVDFSLRVNSQRLFVGTSSSNKQGALPALNTFAGATLWLPSNRCSSAHALMRETSL